ncbi:MAG: hypothetical protein JOZ62_09850 [Acidobacteriaceae bacterium]|nr:hypothetical protein [Acidobacteriaceae bacterium]
MKNVEQELQEALARVEAPAGFAERTMARIAEQRPARFRSVWYGAVAAALALLLAFGVVERTQRERRRRAEITERQVVFALALAVDKFDQISARLQKSAPELRVKEKQRNDL